MPRLKNRAFTLLEVMLAVAILSLGLVMVVRSYTASLRAIKISQNYLIANLLTEQKIWEKQQEQAQDPGTDTSNQDGTFEAPWDNFNYQITFAAQSDLIQESTNPFSLYQATISASWQEPGGERSMPGVTFFRAKEE